MNLMKSLCALALVVLGGVGFSSESQAAVNAFWSAGTNCAGTASAGFAPGGPAIKMSLCVTTTAPTAMCGHTILLQSASVPESGRFNVSALLLGSSYSDPNNEVPPLPIAISNPPILADLGGTLQPGPGSPIPATANQLLATFDISPQSLATNASYVISLAPVSAIAVDADGTCGQNTVPTDLPITASFTLTKTNSPSFSSANAATFATGVANTFTVTATGSPAPTLAISGALPAGVTFNTGTGVLSGNPSTVGTFPLTFTASNGNLPNATQNFTLTVSGKASQTITFNGPPSQNFGGTPIGLVGSASSGLPVSFFSITPYVCFVSGGTSVIMVTAGTCTITANQAGNATFNAAPQVTQSFGVIGTVPGAPNIGTVTPGNGQAVVAFTTPASNGGSPVTSFTATCGASSTSGPSSPLAVTGLVNGNTVACSVTATNQLGTGSASGSVNVTPSAAAPLSLIAVQSRKVHGPAGTFDLTIDTSQIITGPVTVESRSIGAGHSIVFQFNNPITVSGTATAVDQNSQPIGSVATAFAGNEVTVTLTGVPDKSRVTISLINVNGVGLNVSAPMGFLVGDQDGSGAVNGGDISVIRARSGQTATSAIFRGDFDASGSINGGDISVVRARSGNQLP